MLSRKSFIEGNKDNEDKMLSEPADTSFPLLRYLRLLLLKNPLVRVGAIIIGLLGLLAAMLMATVIGVTIGLLAGYYGGKLDLGLMRFAGIAVFT